MLQLIFVSFLWAFSFGLIKSQLTGLDSNLVAALRLWISFLIFSSISKARCIEENRSLQRRNTLPYWSCSIWADVCLLY